jgi:hypothetical protein
MALNRITANRVTLRRMTGPSLGITQPSFIEYLVLAGGGGSYDGSGQNIYAQGGGGGGGGLRTGLAFPAVGAVLQVTVGGGGSGSSSGSNSSITFNNPAVWSNVVCDGGGRGAFFGYPVQIGNGSLRSALPGGSGGGGYAQPQWNGVFATGAAGYPPLGNNGGGGSANPSSASASGGGGGAGGAGGAGGFPSYVGGAGGVGISSAITGSSLTYGAGGAGIGSGGAGTQNAPGGAANASAPLANRGGGAGGCDGGIVGPTVLSGASGVVILKSVIRASSTTGSATETNLGSSWLYQFTGSGTITFLQ